MEVWKKIGIEIKSEKDTECIIETLKSMGYSKEDIEKGKYEMKDFKEARNSCSLKKI